MYRIVYEKRTIKSLLEIDKWQQHMIVSWIEKNLIRTSDPKRHGIPLKGALKDYWRYRVGNYRILADIDQVEVRILIVNVGHPKNIYNI